MKTQNSSTLKQSLESSYNSSRVNLLLVVAFTVINIVLLVIQSNSYFLFSAFIPYFIADTGMFLCGKYPTEYYAEGFNGMQFLGTPFLVVCLIIAGVIIALYLLSWFLSKNNKYGWLIFSLVFFAIDTVTMLVLSGIKDSIIDIVFHIWVIVSLSRGIYAAVKLKKLPEEETQNITAEEIDIIDYTAEINQDVAQNSDILRVADMAVKSKILLEGDAFGHKVFYRRVGKVNELVIDGNVYDEFEALVELAHSLNANIDGHLIEVGFDGSMHSFMKIDGEVVAKKLRLI